MPLSYLEWNERLFDHFFNNEKEGTEVLIYANKNIIEHVGENGSTFDDFIETVKNWHGFTHEHTFCQKALHTLSEWHIHPENFSCPPYIGYLVFFVYVSTTDDPTASDSYHRKLNTILGQPERDSHPQPSFYEMWKLWEDLEYWSSEIKEGRFGQYTRWSHGYHEHVGIPLSQSLISNEEKARLPCIFYKANLTSHQLISEESLRQLLVTNGESGRNRFSSSLIRFLKDNHPGGNATEEKKQAYKMFLKFVYNELDCWDGTNCDRDEIVVNKKINVHANICLTIRRMSSSAGVRIRYPDNGQFLQSGSGKLTAEYGDHKILLNCDESPGQNKWSKRLESKGNLMWDISNNVDIWKNGAKFLDEKNNSAASLLGSDKGTRVFLHGISVGLSAEDWVETYRIEKNSEFLIASKVENSEQIMDWGKHCDEFDKIDNPLSLKDWTFFKGKNAKESLPGFNNLDIPELRAIRFEGGLRIRGGMHKQFLQTSPPNIVLIGGEGDEMAILKVQGSSRSLPPITTEHQMWGIPADTPCGEPLRVEIGKYDNTGVWKKYAHVKLYLVSAKIQIENNLPKIGKYGEVLEDDPVQVPYLTGAKVYSSI